MPILLTPGSKSSALSRNVTSLRIGSRIKANTVAAAAFIPGVLLKISTDNPSKNDHTINVLRLTPELYFKIK